MIGLNGKENNRSRAVLQGTDASTLDTTYME